MADFDFITSRLAVGGGLWTIENLSDIRRAGFTHIINTQIEFDDRTLIEGDGAGWPDILWLPTEDDCLPKPFEFFDAGVRYALAALDQPEACVLVHCASGVHRAPMVTLAILRAMGHARREARRMIEACRPGAEFPEVYLDSVEAFVAEWKTA